MNRQLHDLMMSQYATPKVSGDGLVSWEKGVKCVLPSVKLFGAAVQETLAGKNLFDPNAETTTSGAYIGFTQYFSLPRPFVVSISLKPGKELPSDASFGYIFRKTTDGLASADWLVKDGSLIATQSVVTDIKYALELIGAYPQSALASFLDVLNIQLELGSTATAYEPYCGGIPAPNPGYPIMPVCNDGVFIGCGRNLFDIKAYPLTQGRYLNGNNGNLLPSSNYAVTFGYVPCISGTTITLNKRPGGMNPGFCFYTSDFVFISGVANNGAEAGTPWTIAVPNEAYYMRFTVPIGETDIQVELGDTATPYTPYWDGGQATAPELWAIPGTDIRDEWDAQTGKGIRRVGVIDIDGLTYNHKFTGTDKYWSNGYNYAYFNARRIYESTGVCSHFKCFNYDAVLKEDIGLYFTINNSSIALLLPDDISGIVSTDTREDIVNKINAYVASVVEETGQTVKIWYALAEPEPFYHAPARLTQPHGPGQIIQLSGSVPKCPIEVNYLTHAGGAK